MGAILSKPKIPSPSPEQLKAEEEARAAQAEQRALLAEQKESEEAKRLREMQSLQERKRRARYGGARMLLDQSRGTPEAGLGALGAMFMAGAEGSEKLKVTPKKKETLG